MKILFQGDSITDSGRDRKNMHNLGKGYPNFAAELIRERFPEEEFEFINLGISGNQTADLVSRIQSDFVDIMPDIVSIMIGINDTWHRAETRMWLPNEEFENNYRKVLTAIKEKTNAKIMMIEPYLLPVPDKEFFREDVDKKIQIIRKLAREFASAYLPTDAMMAEVCIEYPPNYWAADGVHPTFEGAKYIGQLYTNKIQKLIEDLIKTNNKKRS